MGFTPLTGIPIPTGIFVLSVLRGEATLLDLLPGLTRNNDNHTPSISFQS
jgi:hypothetical protein